MNPSIPFYLLLAATVLWAWYTRPSAKVRRLLGQYEILEEAKGHCPEEGFEGQEERLASEAERLDVIGLVAARREAWKQ